MTDSDADIFEGLEPVQGLEALGRAIVDAAGVPSGSPANYEHLRSATDEAVITAEDRDRILADLKAEFGIAED